MSMQVVIDTNVVLSSIFWSGLPRTRLNFIALNKIKVLATPDTLAELDRKLNTKKFGRYIEIKRSTPILILNEYQNIVVLVEPPEIPDDAVRDPKDRIILACAVGGQADYIISGDKDLTILGIYAGIPILTPAQFLNMLDPQNND